MNISISFLATFTILSFINVFGSTIKTLTQLKCSKMIASLTSALYYGFYTVVLIYTVSDGIPMWLKILIVVLCNFFGTYLANAIFERTTKKERTWRITVSAPETAHEKIERGLEACNLDYREFGCHKGWYMYDVFCSTYEESAMLRDYIITPDCKYIISEAIKSL